MTDNNNNPVGRPLAYSSAADMHLLIKEYFEAWERKGRPLTVVAMALYLDITMSTLWLYESGHYDTPNEQFSNTIKKAKMYIESQKWENALLGHYDKTIAIFDLKVNHKAIEFGKVPDELPAARPEEAVEPHIDNIDYSGLTDEQLKTMSDFRDILKASVDKVGV